MRLPFITVSRVPAALDTVTTIRAGAEVDPGEVGVEPESVFRIWQAIERWYASGVHPAIQLCVRRRGKVLIDRAIGHAVGNGPDDAPDTPKVLATPDTPFCIFSASKAITAMVVHLLDQRNLIRLDDPVCEYIPAFGVHKKQWITIRHVLSHRAGIPNVPPEAMDPARLSDMPAIVDMLCQAKPTSRPGRTLAYHAITGGFLLGEVVRRVTGKNIRTVLDEEIRRPLGLRWLRYGVRKPDLHRVAKSYFTGPPPLPPFSTVLSRALGIDFRQAVELSNDPRFLLGVVPSGNIVTTATELSRFYEMLLQGGSSDGVQIFEPRTIARATTEQSYFEIDFMLGLPLRHALGFMLGAKWFSPYGPDTAYAFGHLGFTNIISWADPERDVAAALITSGKPLVYPQIYHAFDALRQIGIACAKKSPKSKVRSSKFRPRDPKGTQQRPAHLLAATPGVEATLAK